MGTSKISRRGDNAAITPRLNPLGCIAWFAAFWRAGKPKGSVMGIAIETIGAGDEDKIFVPSLGTYSRVNHRTDSSTPVSEIVVRSRRGVDGLTSRRVSVLRFGRYSAQGNLLDDWYAVRDCEHSRYEGGRNVDELIGRFVELTAAKSFAEKLWSET